ncbi:hypothetical protein [Pikeienuella sp. HZG-20]|uniref:hypothetical protein n=1 Tax=Paludibacillus litoralis TaxID=3133267 RepID=UPI0030ECE00E
MNVTGSPDLVSHSRVTRTLAQVQKDFTRVSEELTTGVKSDVVAATGGDPAQLYALERNIALNEKQGIVIELAISRSSVTQDVLERLEAATGAVGVRLAAAVSIGDLRGAEIEAGRARGAFEEAVSALNSRFGERSLFAGAATDGPALAPADAILAEIKARVAPAATAADAIAAVEDYFSDPAGFAATGYLGSTTDASAAEIAPGQRIDFAVRADQAEVVAALSALAIGVIGAEGGFAGATQAARLEVMGGAATRGLAASDGVVALRARTGVAEEQLDIAKVRTESERTFLQIARNRVIASDPFEAGVAFNALETQLQTIFSVTARLSSLNLASYLR